MFGSSFFIIFCYSNLNCMYCAGLKRTGRSCRLRWVNSLRPGLKRSKITSEEERLIIKLHGRWGNRYSYILYTIIIKCNIYSWVCDIWISKCMEIQTIRWSHIARSLPGRTDNEIKNYWRTRIKGKLNLQDESGSCGMDVERSLDSSCLPTSSQGPPDNDSAVLH